MFQCQAQIVFRKTKDESCALEARIQMIFNVIVRVIRQQQVLCREIIWLESPLKPLDGPINQITGQSGSIRECGEVRTTLDKQSRHSLSVLNVNFFKKHRAESNFRSLLNMGLAVPLSQIEIPDRYISMSMNSRSQVYLEQDIPSIVNGSQEKLYPPQKELTCGEL